MPRNGQEYVFWERAAAAAPPRRCEWPDCDGEGVHRAPKSREPIEGYFWFCLEHVRIYNRTWNYYAGMSDEEVEADVRRDTVWQRPSWPLGVGRAFGRSVEDMIDSFGLFGEPPRREARQRLFHPSSPEARAMTVLELEPPLTASTVKARYKELVKIHHPDVNGGDKAAEERFKEIHLAYETIMERLGP